MGGWGGGRVDGVMGRGKAVRWRKYYTNSIDKQFEIRIENTLQFSCRFYSR